MELFTKRLFWRFLPRFLFTLVFVILTMRAIGQISFEPGYFVDVSGRRVECLIRNEKWKNNPYRVQFKRGETEHIETASPKTWKQFGFSDGTVYESKRTEIEQSSNRLNDLDDRRGPVFKSDTVFLRLIVTGKAALYQYEEENKLLFFIQVDGDTLVPLVNKMYRVTVTNTQGSQNGGGSEKVARNELYRGQLRTALNCPHIDDRQILSMRYTQKSLVEFVSHYNGCQSDQPTVSLPSIEKRVLLQLNIRAGAAMNAMDVISGPSLAMHKIGPSMSSRIGLEAEIALPSRGNRWGIIVETSYQSFGATDVTPGLILDLKYNTVDLSVGPRYRVHSGKNSSVFFNGGFAYAFSLDSRILINNYYELECNALPYYWIGAGFQWMRLSAEFRYLTPRDPMNKYRAWPSTLSGTPYAIISYRIY